jgi:hypothetical protein
MGREVKQFLSLIVAIVLMLLFYSCARVNPVLLVPPGLDTQPSLEIGAVGAPAHQYIVFKCRPPAKPVEWYILAMTSLDQAHTDYHEAGILSDWSIDLKLPAPIDGCYMASATACKYTQSNQELCGEWSPWFNFEWPIQRKCIVPCILYPLLLMEDEQ